MNSSVGFPRVSNVQFTLFQFPNLFRGFSDDFTSLWTRKILGKYSESTFPRIFRGFSEDFPSPAQLIFCREVACKRYNGLGVGRKGNGMTY
jgi:hypothetical protein